MFELGQRIPDLQPHRLRDIATPYMEDLPALLAFSGPDRVRAVLRTGLSRRTPYTIVAPGLFVRELERVRQRGFAFDSEEAKIGVTCIAAPVLTGDRGALAALSISGPVGRLDPRKYARQLCAAASQVARRLEAGAS